MGKVKLLLDVIGDLRSLADSLQAVADAVAENDAAEAELTTTKEPEKAGKNREGCRKEHGEEGCEACGKAGGEAADAGGSPRGAGGEVPLRTHGGSEGAACKAWCG